MRFRCSAGTSVNRAGLSFNVVNMSDVKMYKHPGFNVNMCDVKMYKHPGSA